MRDLQPAFYQALIAAKDSGIVPRRLVSFTGWSWESGARQTISYWNEDDDVTVSLTSQIDDEPTTRVFYGGNNLEVGRIVRSSELVVQTVQVSFSANAPAVEQLSRGMDIRLAAVEIWDALLDPRSRKLIGTEPAFLGVVDGAPINTAGVDGEDVVEINVVNDLMVMLTRTNPAKSSDEEQKKRQGDRFSQYAGSVKSWNIPWGQK